MKEERDKIWEVLLDYGLCGSYGIQKCKSGEFNAWINYNPPYKENGGNWNAYEDTEIGALKTLFKHIQEFRKSRNLKEV